MTALTEMLAKHRAIYDRRESLGDIDSERFNDQVFLIRPSFAQVREDAMHQ
jgi:hypothetical protein